MSTPLPSPIPVIPRPGTSSSDAGTPRSATPTAPGGFHASLLGTSTGDLKTADDSTTSLPTPTETPRSTPRQPHARTPSNPTSTNSLLSFLPTFSLPSLSIPSFSLASMVPGTFSLVQGSESEESMKGLGRSGSARLGGGRRRKDEGVEREDERWSMDLRIEEGQSSSLGLSGWYAEG